MADKRENILAALFAALETVDDDGGAAMDIIDRNGAVELDEGKRPALRMWDGDEVSGTLEARPIKRGGRHSVTAQPAIFGYVKADQDLIGPAINALLWRVRKAILTSTALADAIGTDGVISQDSLITGLAAGKKTEGHFGLHLNITYQFDPTSP